MGCSVLRKFRAFSANHCNLIWARGKKVFAGCTWLILAPGASQRDSESPLSSPRAFCSTGQRHEIYPPPSRTSDEQASQLLETKRRHRVRTHVLYCPYQHITEQPFQRLGLWVCVSASLLSADIFKDSLFPFQTFQIMNSFQFAVLFIVEDWAE